MRKAGSEFLECGVHGGLVGVGVVFATPAAGGRIVVNIEVFRRCSSWGWCVIEGFVVCFEVVAGIWRRKLGLWRPGLEGGLLRGGRGRR